MHNWERTKNPAAYLEQNNPDATIANEILQDKTILNINELGLIDRPDVVDTSSENIWVPLWQPPTALFPNLDTSMDFRIPVNHVWLQNNSGQVVYFEFDNPVGPGSLQLSANVGTLFVFDGRCKTLHLMCQTAVNINAFGPCIVVRGMR